MKWRQNAIEIMSKYKRYGWCPMAIILLSHCKIGAIKK